MHEVLQFPGGVAALDPLTLGGVAITPIRVSTDTIWVVSAEVGVKVGKLLAREGEKARVLPAIMASVDRGQRLTGYKGSRASEWMRRGEIKLE